MEDQIDRTDAAILRVLAANGSAVGAARIGRELEAMGLDVRPRTIRFRLLRLDEIGLTECVSRRAGRRILPRGREELERVHVVEKLGFVAARMDVLGYRMTFDPVTRGGSVIANVAIIRRQDLPRAIYVLSPVFGAGLGMGARLTLARQGEVLAGVRIPPGRIGLATVCSVVVNGMLLKRGIPVVSRFGGLLEIRKHKPARFVQLIAYSGTTMDPLDAYIKAGMTSVAACAETGSGVVGASFREIPTVAMESVLRAREAMDACGLSGILMMGQPNQPLLGMPVAEGRVGMVVIGGMNPFAAMVEAGIPVEIESLCGLEDWDRLKPFGEFESLARRRSPYVD